MDMKRLAAATFLGAVICCASMVGEAKEHERGMPKPGEQVQISDARVVEKQGDRVFWIESKGERTPVLLSQDAAQKAQLQKGDQVRISGTVGPVPKDPQELPIDPELAKKLQQERKFIFATEVQEMPPGTGGQSGGQRQQ